jgi:hypothetical protein
MPEQDDFDKALDAAQGTPAAETPAPAASPTPASQQATPSTTPNTPVAPSDSTPAAPRRSVKVKLDKEETEIDDSWFADEEKSKRLKETFEKGYGFDRAVERARSEATELSKRQWNDWIKAQPFNMVQDSTAPSGWKLVPKQVAMPAEVPTDPLAKEEAELQAKIDAAEIVDPKWLRRLSQIDAERAKLGAVKEWDARLAAVTQKAQAEKTRADAEAWLNGEIDKSLTARAKSFEGPDSSRRSVRIRATAFAAGEQAAMRGLDPIAAAQAVVSEEANDLDARQAAWRASLSQAVPQTSPPPVLGATPAGANGTGKSPDLNTDEGWDQAFDTVNAKLASRR